MTKAKFKTLGVYVNGEDPGQKERFLGELSKAFRDHKIYIKPLLTYSMEQIARMCTQNDIEGIVFHEQGGSRMCKIRKSDFGLNR